MKRTRRDSEMPPGATINVTPIIDVALVLVIILLITAPMLSLADIDVTLPAAVSRGAEEEVKINITMSKTGELAINEHIVRGTEFGPSLRTLLSSSGNKDVLVVLRADTEVPYSSIRSVLGEARAAGAARLAIATLQKGGCGR
ncbi:MAG TPA: biopolymer transporter ExbD [Candidatus Krumholzibacterium sp.]|nr:biopolymer transporter ExbD [Candidatus Krumholzibacterium sp.]